MNILFFEFLNTLWKKNHGDGTDPLEDSHWVNDFALRLIGMPLIDDFDGNEALIELRTEWLEAIRYRIIPEDALESLILELSALLHCSVGIRTIEGSSKAKRLCFKPLKADLEALQAELAEQFYRLLTEQERSRIRICENPDCRYVFYDDSKNKSKRHCYSGCSNLMKVRRFRERKKGDC